MWRALDTYSCSMSSTSLSITWRFALRQSLFQRSRGTRSSVQQECWLSRFQWKSGNVFLQETDDFGGVDTEKDDNNGGALLQELGH